MKQADNQPSFSPEIKITRDRVDVSGFDYVFRKDLMQRIPALKILFFFLIAVLGHIFMSGCTPQTRSVSLGVDTTQVFSNAGTQEMPGRWWTTFGDDDLNVLVDSALASNFNLLTAWQRLREARAVVD